MKKKIDNPTSLDVLGMFLSSGLLDYFDLINGKSLETCFILFLEEKNIIPKNAKHFLFIQKDLYRRSKFRIFLYEVKQSIIALDGTFEKILKPVKHIAVIGIWLPPALA